METSENILYRTYTAVRDSISKVVVGKQDIIDKLLVAVFCRGHVLLEDVPGTGKTLLIKSLAASLDCTAKRIQFTPDLLPSDLTGINYYNMKKSEFEFSPGPVFSNIVLADEINRATPKTQSGLLECMEERQATIDGVTHRLAEPFIVVATQNPVENAGVYPLPEAELDRFLFKTSMNYPTHEECVSILDRFDGADPLSELKPAVGREDIIASQQQLDRVYVHRDLKDYIASLCERTRAVRQCSARCKSPGRAEPASRIQGLRCNRRQSVCSSPTTSSARRRRCLPTALCCQAPQESSAALRRASSPIFSDRVPVPTERGLGYWQAK